MSLDKTEAPTLRFRSHQDALDFAAHSVKESARRLAAQKFDAVDRYRKGEVACHLRINSRRTGHQGDLVFLRVPGSGLRHPPVVADCTSVIDHDRGGDIERDQSAVFLGVCDLVESPENVIRSFVWLERCKEIADFRW